METETPLEENFVKEILDSYDRVPERSRAGTYNGYVHVSSLSYDFCARQYAIAHKEQLSLYESLTGGHKVTFRIGRAVESHIRESFIAHYGEDKIYAKWICVCGNKYYEGLGSNPQCSCGEVVNIFNEPDLSDDVSGVSGHPDLVFLRAGKLRVLEIKSIKKDAWDELEEPQPAHKLQAGIYPHLLSKRTKFNVSPEVVFIYCTKDFKFGSPYKEFHLDTSTPEFIKEREELFAEAKQVKDFAAGGEMPGRICQSMSSALAKKCPVNFRCFHVYD